MPLKQDPLTLSDPLGAWHGDEAADPASADERPLRAELYGTVQMAQHGRRLSAQHQLDGRRGPDRLLPRLAENASVLAHACAELTAALQSGRQVTPASEWLLDNFYLIEEHIRLARRHLPRNYSRELPRLSSPGLGGVPRVYHLALEVVAHGDGHIDPESLARFVSAYQEQAPLKLGELWAIPIMLRLALIENLRRVAASVVRCRCERDLANHWADRMTETAERSPARLILLVADMARSEPPMTRSFVAELARRLQGHSAPLALQWLTTHLADLGLTIEQMVQAEIAHQAADQVSIANSIGSLRLLGTMDWKEFVETLSPVEQTLRLDPDGTYARMDFTTRDMYRHQVETLARKSGVAEGEVAAAALALASTPRGPSEGGLDPRTRHIGHYLVGEGSVLLERQLGLRHTRLSRLATLQGRRTRLAAFLGAIVTFTLLFTFAGLDRTLDHGMDDVLATLFVLVFALGTSQLAVALVNFIATQLTRPRILPRMDYRHGVPGDARSIVVIPSMLFSAADVHSLCEALEVRYLANRDPNLRFCLLTDFGDADAETIPGDAELLELARTQIDALNARYESDCATGEHETRRVRPFLLLHRARRWNAREGVWMGYERKRGKLGELNAFLRGGARDSFLLVAGSCEELHQIRYVITLDTDTLLPRDAARQLVATLSHPLNQPQVAPDGSRVVAGYGILQPRVSVSLSSGDPSRYELLCGGEQGIDPYTRLVSDVYQDLFGEGSFIGKGIYDIDVFERVLGNRLPENLVLSHDLLEGCYLRAGLLSDLQLFEPYPARYSADISRRHRWVRGDWQIAGWLRPTVPGPDGRRVSNPLTPLSRWKVFDNLRRSLVAPAFTALLVMSWAVIPVDWFWTAAVLAAMFVPPLLAAVFNLIEKPHGVQWVGHLASVWRNAARALGQAALALVFLPYEAYVNLDAIARTAWRMLVSRRRLLEWLPSNMARSSTNLASNLRNMWFAPMLAIGCAVALQLSNPLALLLAGPFLLAWLLSPMVAWWISQPIPDVATELSAADARFLHRLARRTWSFFETYVTQADNWLPPDNMQEHPKRVVAHRTSPTNIGMSLLSNLAAWDFGYITSAQLAARCQGTVGTLGRMERYHGHWLNWYDTQTLEPLLPRYVSSVDSGNLAGHLLTLAAGLERVPDEPLIEPRVFQGIATTLDIVAELAREAPEAVTRAIAVMQAELNLGAQSAGGHTLPGLAERLSLLCSHARSIADAAAGGGHELADWSARLQEQCSSFYDELVLLAPWAARADQFLLDSRLTRVPTLRELAELRPPEEAAESGNGNGPAALARLIAEGRARALDRIAQFDSLAQSARAMARMDFTFLYNRGTKLLAIGYNVTDRRMDVSAYDLLASEIRLGSFVAIALGQLPEEHWFAMGRQLRRIGNEQVLVSWSGSMFEYLMPLLVMPSYPGTLLHQTYRAVVRIQAEYGRQHEVPWGISESGYTTVDAALNYQYHAFGVPGLGLKRGLGDDLVVAPYASMMGLMVDPELSAANLRRMAQLGFMGRHGFYEAIDYTQPRLPRGHDHAVVRSFMAHHQGMGFLALDYVLCGQPMQRRFEFDPQLRATLLVLQERVPKAGAFAPALAPHSAVAMPAHEQPPPMRVVSRTVTPVPEVHLLSNGRYHVMISSAGAGYSRWRGSAVTRWREDGTRDHWGSFCYVRDVDSGAVWSTTYQPTLVEPQGYEAVFAASRAEFRRHDRGIDLYTEVVVSPEDDIEMRRTRVTNNSASRRTLELTSYAEVAIAPQAADSSHPAFSKLFVQTELLPEERAVLCVRRPRRLDEPVPCMLHLVSVHDTEAREVSFETSRPVFLGRGNDASKPAAMGASGPLSGTSGAVLDPIVAIRCRIELEPGDSATLDYVTGMADTRDSARHLIDKYQDRTLADRVFELAWTHSQVVLRQLNATEAWAQMYARLAAAVIYPQAGLRADPSALVRNQRGQSGLWAYAISGDLPIVLLLLRDHNSVDLARQMVQAHAYWRLKGLQLDLVIWYQDTGYRQTLRDQIIGMITSGIDAQAIDRPGGIFVRAWDQVSPEDQVLMLSVARVVIDDAHGPLSEQVARASRAVPKFAPLAPEPDVYIDYEEATAALPELRMFNGRGGFTPDGREYVIRTRAGDGTPAPWSNVLANPSFGSIVSESGQAYTWSENAHEFRLTPWHNDPVSDSSGEAFYIRDEQSGRFWSPSPLPAMGTGDYLTRHGFGYSVFEHTQDAIYSEMTTFVALGAALKYTVIRLRNDGDTLRRVSVTGYVEWVLGDMRDKTGMHVVTELDNASGALFARNAYNQEFGGRVAFFHVNAQIRTVTGDRSEFVGRTRTLADPAAMRRRRLSGRVGPALDPCGAFCAPFALHPGEERELVFVLGIGGRRTADATHVIETCGGSDAATAALAKVRAHWEEVLGAVQVSTPDPALDLMANGWLMYQTIACRMWARSGYYQSSGAFGFRDQLQDAMAVVHTRPQLLRDQLLLCAAHQFLQGDVQHWWHPPSGRGVRTHCSDDYLWLPLAAARYVSATGDYALLAEPAPYLEGRPLNPDEESYYDMPGRAHVQGSLYEHCVRAIRHGLRVGQHGLPLIGTCDWNDGMDRVGHEGKGESVWLAWFLIAVLERFAPVAAHQGDSIFAQLCRDHATQLAQSIEANAWDGGWYRRAYFDDGTPLGSSSNDECRIDSISQSWAVLSGAGDPERARAAMEQVDQQLVRRDARLVQLLDPPFDKTRMDPGYIRGYLPGVRENGGQYTHAAIWTAMAFAELGDVERAWELQRMLNPAIHASTPDGVETYKVEPYAVAADVYGVPPHIGRGGWTWYTGSAGWMYRLIVESLLGVRVEGGALVLKPLLPAGWDGFSVRYRHGATLYLIEVRRGDAASLSLDGQPLEGDTVALSDDGAEHRVELAVPRA